ncbi:hypothetical protein Peur_040370 [Populus x canadensis]
MVKEMILVSGLFIKGVLEEESETEGEGVIMEERMMAEWPDLVVAGSIRAGDCWAVVANSNEVLGWCGGACSGVHVVRL